MASILTRLAAVEQENVLLKQKVIDLEAVDADLEGALTGLATTVANETDARIAIDRAGASARSEISVIASAAFAAVNEAREVVENLTAVVGASGVQMRRFDSGRVTYEVPPSQVYPRSIRIDQSSAFALAFYALRCKVIDGDVSIVCNAVTTYGYGCNGIELAQILEGIVVITGSIKIYSGLGLNGYRTLIFKSLEFLGGSFGMSQTAYTRPSVAPQLIEMPELRRVGGEVKISNQPAVSAVLMPKLQTIGDDPNTDDNRLMGFGLTFDSNTRLQHLDFKSLETVNGAIQITNNPQLLRFYNIAGGEGYVAIDFTGMKPKVGLRSTRPSTFGSDLIKSGHSISPDEVATRFGSGCEVNGEPVARVALLWIEKNNGLQREGDSDCYPTGSPHTPCRSDPVDPAALTEDGLRHLIAACDNVPTCTNGCCVLHETAILSKVAVVGLAAPISVPIPAVSTRSVCQQIIKP
jgi:hypothetical protein